jgi:CBS domain-containing protein
MRVEELMTKNPIVVEVPGTRDDALKLLAHHSVSGVPVVKAKTGKLAGVVTRSDIFRHSDEEQLALIMTAKPFTIGPREDVAKAAKVFFEKRIHGLPVVNSDAELLGVISPSDVLKVIAESSSKKTIGDLGTASVFPVHTSTPLAVVWEIMNLNHQNALPVLDDDAGLAGIVTDSDLFKKSQVDDIVKKAKLAVGEDEDSWSWDSFRSIMPLYLSNSKVKLPKAAVKEVMTSKVETVFTRASVSEAAKKMRKFKVNQLPILDTHDRLLGVVTDLDLMQVMT